jgi:hypothetical protein
MQFFEVFIFKYLNPTISKRKEMKRKYPPHTGNNCESMIKTSKGLCKEAPLRSSKTCFGLP